MREQKKNDGHTSHACLVKVSIQVADQCRSGALPIHLIKIKTVWKGALEFYGQIYLQKFVKSVQMFVPTTSKHFPILGKRKTRRRGKWTTGLRCFCNHWINAQNNLVLRLTFFSCCWPLLKVPFEGRVPHVVGVTEGTLSRATTPQRQYLIPQPTGTADALLTTTVAH